MVNYKWKTCFMNKLSYWARSHATAARALIVCIHILLFGLSLVLAGLFGGTGSNSTWVFITIGVALSLFIFYPARPLVKSEILRHLYVYRKRIFNASISALGFLLYILVFTSETPVTGFYGTLEGSNTGYYVTVKPGDSTKTYLSLPDFAKQYHSKELTAKDKRQLLKKQLKAIKKADDMSNGAKTALIVLTIVVALGLLYLLAALSCSLSCAGSGAAATIVLILGVPAIVFLTIFAIRRITGKRRRRKLTEDPAPGQ